MDEDYLDKICPDYEGTRYDVDGDTIPFMTAEGYVSLCTVVYKQGDGMNMRVVSVPGSHPTAFALECAEYGLCDCTPPTVWLFTGIALDGSVHTIHTLDGHEAVHILRHPDHIFNGVEGQSTMHDELRLVPPEHGLDMVVQETQEYLTSRGVKGLADEGAITYSEFVSTDVDDLISQFMEVKDDPDNG